MKTTIQLVLIFWVTFAYAGKSMPVMVGGSEESDACGAWAEVRGLDAQGDGFLAVRSGAGSKFSIKDKLHNGNGVFMCGNKGKWIAIVYGENCGVASPIIKSKAYTGPCKYGWVFEKYIELLAG